MRLVESSNRPRDADRGYNLPGSHRSETLAAKGAPRPSLRDQPLDFQYYRVYHVPKQPLRRRGALSEPVGSVISRGTTSFAVANATTLVLGRGLQSVRSPAGNDKKILGGRLSFHFLPPTTSVVYNRLRLPRHHFNGERRQAGPVPITGSSSSLGGSMTGTLTVDNWQAGPFPLGKGFKILDVDFMKSHPGVKIVDTGMPFPSWGKTTFRTAFTTHSGDVFFMLAPAYLTRIRSGPRSPKLLCDWRTETAPRMELCDRGEPT